MDSTKNSLKKYETYLDYSEDVVNYLLQMIRRETEISKAILEKAFVGQPFNIKEFSRSLESEEENEQFKNALSRIGKSQMLKKKGLFQGIDEKVKIVRLYDRTAIQDMYNRMLEKDEELIKRYKEQQMACLNPNIEEDEKEFLFEQYYENFINNMLVFKNLIKDNFFESFDVERLIFVGQTMKEFIDVIKQYLHRVK